MTGLDRGELLRRLGVGAAAVAAGGGVGSLAAPDAGAAPAELLPSHPRWRLVALALDTTDPLYVPFQYGAQDACDLFRCTFEWRGSGKGRTAELAKAIETAVSEKADGIAVTWVDGAIDGAVAQAAAAGIPVVAFHSAPARPSRLIPFVGASAYETGRQIGARVAAGRVKGPVLVGTTHETDPAVRQRARGIADALRKAGARATVQALGTDSYFAQGAVAKLLAAGQAPATMVGADEQATEGIALALKQEPDGSRRVATAGHGVLPTSVKMVEEGRMAFAVDEQPYLQGFVVASQLALARLSSGLVQPSPVDTGPVFVTRANVARYTRSRSRFEGSSSKHRYPLG